MEASVFLIQLFLFCFLVSSAHYVPESKYKNYLFLSMVSALLLSFLIPVSSFMREIKEAFLIIPLVIFVFYISTKFRLKEFDHLHTRALCVAALNLISSIAIFGTVAWFLLQQNFFYAIILSLAVSATDPLLINIKKKTLMNLQLIESSLKSIIVLILAFFLITNNNGSIQSFNLLELGLNVIIGASFGLIVGLLFLKISHRLKGSKYYFAVIALCFIVFVVATTFEANGVAAVAIIGFLLANIDMPLHSENKKLKLLSKKTSRYFMFPVYFMATLFLDLKLSPDIFLKAFLLFLVYIIIKVITLHFSTKDLPINFKEKISMVFSNPLGSAGILVILALHIFLPGMVVLSSLLFLILLFSFFSSIIFDMFTGGDVK